MCYYITLWNIFVDKLLCSGLKWSKPPYMTELRRPQLIKNTHPMILSSFGSLTKRYLHCHQELMQLLTVCIWRNIEERHCGKTLLHANDIQSFSCVGNMRIGDASFILCRNYGLKIKCIIVLYCYYNSGCSSYVMMRWWASFSSLSKTLHWCTGL